MRQPNRRLAIALLVLSLLPGCAEKDGDNAAPVIQSITASDDNPDPGETITLSCSASDADGDALSYAWKADGLAIGGDAASIQWQAPAANGAVNITVDVSDGEETAHDALALTVGRDEFALLTAITDPGFAAWTANWIKDATYVHNNLASLFVVDLRSSLDYSTGHIAGAENATLAGLADYVAVNNLGGEEVALVCYTGQTAAFAAMGLRMLGYDCFSMKWGMAGWNDALAGPWDTGISNDYSADMVTTASPALPVYDWPVLDTGLASGQAILEARVEAVFAEGFNSNAINAYEVMDSPGTYHINNYWVQTDYEDIGHISGSYQLTPGTLTTALDLSGMHPTQVNVLYCWTGQTSAFTGFYLNVLGYDLLSLRFGANALMHEDLPQNAWAHQGLNYPLVTD